MELLSSNTKKIQETETPKKNSLYFRKWKPKKKLLIFWET